MISCEKLRILSYFFILILALTLSAKGKPRIEGSEIIVSNLGQNVSIECFGNRSVTWFKYVNKTGKPKIINEESHTDHIELEVRGYIEWADPDETLSKEFLAVLQIEYAQIEDSGLYVCTYESDFETILKRVKKNKSNYFDAVQLNVKLMKPRIDVGKSMILNGGDNFNLTCSGDRPVTWVLTNNHTWGIQHTESESENQTIYLSVLEIENVNFTDVGYFVCKYSDTSSNVYEDFNDFVHEEEMNFAATYVFVKDINHLIVQQDTNEFTAQLSKKVIIPCKPTFPEVKISLVALDGSMNEKKIFHYPHSIHTGSLLIGETASTTKLICTARFLERVESVYFTVTYYNPILSSVNLTVEGTWQMNSLERMIHTYDVVEGEVLMINCSTQYKKNIARIMWQTPASANEKKRHVLRVRDYEDKTVETRIFPKVSLKKDSGIYSCYVTNNHVNSSFFRFALNVFSQKSSHLLMKAQNKNIYLTQEALFPEPLKWIIYFRAYPALYLNWTINGEPIVIYKIENNQIDHFKSMIKRKEQYEIKVNWFDGEITLIIHSPTIKDTGTYVLSAEVPHKSNNPIKQNITLKFFKKGVPQVVNSVIKPLTRAKLLGTKFTIECSAFGFPFPELKAYFKPCSSRRNCHTQLFGEISNKDIRYNDETIDEIDSNSEITGKRSVRWKGRAKVQGYYLCNAKNDYGSQNSSENLLIISDSGFNNPDFLQIEVRKNEESFVPSFEVSLIEGDDVTITCRGNTFMTSQPLIWTVMTGENSSILFGNKNFSFHEISVSVYENQTELSYISQIMGKASKEMDGMVIKCKDGSITSFEKAVNVTVIDARPPQWIGETLMKRHLILSENEKLNLSCSASGTPFPSVAWYKDDRKLELDESDRRISILEGNLSFEFLFSEDSGKYLCKVTNREGSIEDFVTLEVKDPDAVPQKVLISSIAVFAAISLIVVIILGIKVYKDKKAERSFKLEIQKRFIEGNPESLNPDLDLGEQADLLPYDNKFEFPRDRVTIENLLGSGAFGNVFKATARDLISGVSKTTVAVKMLKSPTNPALMKTLVSELKIMIHIGRHINIVNLLGACSKNMASKGELLLLVEYCRYGNILEYMRRQRTEFLNQININDKIDPSSKYFRRRTNSNSRNSLRTTYAQLDLQRNSIYFANNTDASHDSEHSGRSFIESGATIDTAERRRIKSDSAPNDTITNTDMTTDTIGNSANNYISESVFEQRGPLCSEDLLHWSYQIANGMFYLSEKKVIHGDLAARNILLADKNVVKISDFGLSKNIYKQDNYKKKSECPLPVKWLALEALRDSIFSTHSDVWSYGVVLWEIFSLGSNPYAGVEVDAEFVNKLEKGLRLSHPQYATSELYQIMKRCWNENPNARPSFRQLEKILGDMLGEAEKQMYITLNAHYEENNYISEHLKYLNTPSYDSRVRNFFTEKDEDGYEKALPSPMTPTIPENGVIIENHQKFQLHPVPKKKNLGTQGTKEEMEVLLDSKPPATEYLVMNSPTDIEKPIEMETFSVNNTMYANLRHLNNLNISDAQRKSVQSSESPNIESNSFDPKKDKIFTFNEINSMENDSVFDPDVIDDTYCKSDLPRFIKNGYYENKLNSVSSYNYKHDSGIYSPNLIQNNPIYIHKNNAINESENTIKINANDSSFKTPYCIGKKQRNQSDSSSGIGSLDDRHNSLEKQRNELERLQTEGSILEIRKPLQQIV